MGGFVRWCSLATALGCCLSRVIAESATPSPRYLIKQERDNITRIMAANNYTHLAGIIHFAKEPTWHLI